METSLESLAKVELHAHLNGCIREATLFDLAKECSVALSNQLFHPEIRSLATAVTESEVQCGQFPSTLSDDPPTFFNIRPRSLQDCLAIFAEIPKCVDDLISLRRITLEALEDFAQHNVVYLELRSTPKQLQFDSLNNKSNNYNKTGANGAIIGGNMPAHNTTLATKKDYCHVILQAMEDFEEEQRKRIKDGKMGMD